LRIIEAILAGQRDAVQLTKLRDYRVNKSTVAQMQAALVEVSAFLCVSRFL
jgi:hypothetical protein